MEYVITEEAGDAVVLLETTSQLSEEVSKEDMVIRQRQRSKFSSSIYFPQQEVRTRRKDVFVSDCRHADIGKLAAHQIEPGLLEYSTGLLVP
jgi:hypothetical protein